MPTKNMSSEREPLGPIGILAPLESNFEIDSHSIIESQLHSNTLCILQ